MRKALLSILAIALLVSCGQKGYTIKGEISGLEGKVYLALIQGKTPEFIDSTEVAEGKFEFKGNVEIPIMAALFVNKEKQLTTFFIENSDITISGSVEEAQKMEIKGSKENDLYTNFLTSLASGGKPDSEMLDEFIAANPTSVAAAYLFFRQKSYYLDHNQLREEIAKFSPEVQKSIYLSSQLERADNLEKVDPGKKFIDFEMADTTGNVIKFSEIAGKGKYVLLDFWASWCGPCRGENPNIVECFKQYGEKGFTVFGVSLDKKRENWLKGIADDGLNWTNVSELKFWDCAPAKLYGVVGIPSNYLIDPDGVIIARNTKGEDLKNKLEELLGDKK